MWYEPAMRYAVALVPGLFLACVSAAASCSSSNSGGATPADGDAATDAPMSMTGKDAAEDTSTVTDAGKDVEEPFTVATEVEPNDGKTKTEIGNMLLPGTMNGKIDPVNDTDIFAINLRSGSWLPTPTRRASAQMDSAA